jgi:threonine synthase
MVREHAVCVDCAGGMLLPEEIPRVPEATLKAWRDLSYPQLCVEVLRLFIDESELNDSDLEGIIAKSFTRFGDSRVTPVSEVNGIAVCELWHGPTLAFKDLGLQVLGRLLEHFLARSGRTLTILVGTSGDTGMPNLQRL